MSSGHSSPSPRPQRDRRRAADSAEAQFGDSREERHDHRVAASPPQWLDEHNSTGRSSVAEAWCRVLLTSYCCSIVSACGPRMTKWTSSSSSRRRPRGRPHPQHHAATERRRRAPGVVPRCARRLHARGGPGPPVLPVRRPGRTQEWTVVVLREADSRGGSAYLHEELARGHGAVRARTAQPLPSRRRAGVPLHRRWHRHRALCCRWSPRPTSAGAPWRLVYGGRRRSAMAFADDLVERYGTRWRSCPRTSSARCSVPTLLQFDHGGTAIYCCGPEGLVGAVESHPCPHPAGHAPRRAVQPPAARHAPRARTRSRSRRPGRARSSRSSRARASWTLSGRWVCAC